MVSKLEEARTFIEMMEEDALEKFRDGNEESDFIDEKITEGSSGEIPFDLFVLSAVEKLENITSRKFDKASIRIIRTGELIVQGTLIRAAFIIFGKEFKLTWRKLVN